ncbi:MAG: HypC/HybG/HupF family hydrogenase formation chaperone [Thermoguttaceae bacterium]
MCLGVPAKLVEVHAEIDPPMGRVDFGGILKDVCLAYTPEARVGDYVLIHVGFAISRIEPEEAEETLRFLSEIGAMAGDEGEARNPNPEIRTPNP